MDYEYTEMLQDASLKARKPTLWKHAWIQWITHLNVVSLQTLIHNSPTAWRPPPLELSIHVNVKPKFTTRVLAGSVSVFPLTSRIIAITSCVAPSFSSKSVVSAKPWTEEQIQICCENRTGITSLYSGALKTVLKPSGSLYHTYMWTWYFFMWLWPYHWLGSRYGCDHR